LLDLPPPVILAYPVESVVAEKFQALVDLGSTNSRMKDFYDLWMLAQTQAFDGEALSRAMLETFSRRGTDLPDDTPIGLSDAWASEEQVMGYWRGFLERNGLTGDTPQFVAALPTPRAFLMPPTAALRAGRPFAIAWPAGGPWRE
ncbi:MAG: nucleotidyl transferase AbiEii/AbiGii toxin family protein, partial [Dehalococcoidia bacterium]